MPNFQPYECHVTVAPPATASKRKWFESLALAQGWKTSEIAGDPLLGQKNFFYFTTHAKVYEDIYGKMEKLAAHLSDDREIQVLRKKIEHIVFDTGKKLLKKEQL